MKDEFRARSAPSDEEDGEEVARFLGGSVCRHKLGSRLAYAQTRSSHRPIVHGFGLFRDTGTSVVRSQVAEFCIFSCTVRYSFGQDNRCEVHELQTCQDFSLLIIDGVLNMVHMSRWSAFYISHLAISCI